MVLRSHGHATTVEYAISPKVMIEAAELAAPDLVLCPFLTKRVPKEIYDKYLTLIIHPGAPGDAGPSALDWVLFGDNGADEDATVALEKLFCPSEPETRVQPRGWWGVTVLQAIEQLDGGPIWAWDQFEVKVDGHPDETLTKSALYRGPVTRAAVAGTLAAINRILAVAESISKISPSLVPPPTARTLCVTRGLEFQGGPTHDRPLLKPAQRDFDINIHSASTIARRIRCGDSQPGVLSRIFGKTPLFVYGGIVEENSFPPQVAQRARASPGAIIAQRQEAVLISTVDGKGVWITNLRRTKAKADKHLHPKLPAAMGLKSVPGLAETVGLADVPEWDLVAELGGWQKREGTYQQVWVEVEDYPSASGSVKVAYVFSDFYNGATSTSQAHLLASAINHATSIPSLRTLVLMGGAYFSNGIALNVIEGAADPAAESWANINAIDDVVAAILDPSRTSKRGILTIAAIRGNVSAGGLAVATAADVVLCAEAVVMNPHYRGMGLYGSEYHTFSFHTRAGEEQSKRLLRGMLPMGAKEALEVGFVDHVLGNGSENPSEVNHLVKIAVRSLVTAPTPKSTSDSVVGAGAPWTKPTPDSFLHIDTMLANKVSRLAQLPANFPTYFRESELDQMRLDFFHPIRSQRYDSRRLGFVRKVAPTSTPVRFALHRRWGGPGWSEVRDGKDAEGRGPRVLDEEETDEFDGLGDVPNEVAQVRMPALATTKTNGSNTPTIRREPNHLDSNSKPQLIFPCYYDPEAGQVKRDNKPAVPLNEGQ